jgi:Caspase domain
MEPRRSALIVATDEYADPKLRRLRAPVRDAEELGRVLANQAIGAFEVEVLLNEPEYRIRRKLAEFFSSRTLDDLLLVHFSCHGLKDDDGNLYFATPDTEMEHLDSTAVPSEFVNRQMRKSRSRRIALFLDCCYSGAFSRGAMARAGNGVELAERFDGQGQVVITASNAMEYAFEGDELTGEGTPSVFTTALVEGLESGAADRDGDDLVSVDELYDYVYDRVRETTPDQTPSKWTYDLQGDLFIAKNPNPKPVSSAELLTDLREALESPLAGVRLGALGELERVVSGSNARRAAAARLALETLAADDSRSVSDAAAAALAARTSEDTRREAPRGHAPATPTLDEPAPTRAPDPAPTRAPDPAPSQAPTAPTIVEPPKVTVAAEEPSQTRPAWWGPQWPGPQRAAVWLALLSAAILLVSRALSWFHDKHASVYLPTDAAVWLLYPIGVPLCIALAGVVVVRAQSLAALAGGALVALGAGAAVGFHTFGGVLDDSTAAVLTVLGGAAAVAAGIGALAASRTGSIRRGRAASLVSVLGAGLWIAALVAPWADLSGGWLWWVRPGASAGGSGARLGDGGGPSGTLAVAIVTIAVALASAYVLRRSSSHALVITGALTAVGLQTLLFFGALALGLILDPYDELEFRAGTALGLAAGLAIVVAGCLAYRTASRTDAALVEAARATAST